MDLTELRRRLDGLAESLANHDKQLIEARLQGLASAFPFNDYEYMLMFMLDRTIVTFDQYEQLRRDYVSSNIYLPLFELAPRIFGGIWVQEHITDLDPRFVRPSKQLDPLFAGEYDLWLGGLRVEVKAARAINTKKRGGLASKALAFSSGEPFWMNFQQIKSDACDVFVFVGVWTDEIAYWVLSSEDVRLNKYLSHQHRGGVEYQIGITHRNIREFDGYKVGGSEIARIMIEKAPRRA